MDLLQSLRDILDAESRVVNSIPLTEAYQQALDLIYRQVCQKGGKVVASGMGKAGQIAANIASTFASTGIPAVSINPAEAQHGDLGVIQPNDVLLLISNSGRTEEIVQLHRLASLLYPSMPSIAITGEAGSPLANVPGMVSLFTGNPDEVCPLGLTPHIVHHGHDRDRPHACDRNDEPHWIHPRAVCPAPSGRLARREAP